MVADQIFIKACAILRILHKKIKVKNNRRMIEIEEILKNTIESIKNSIDSESVIGKPIVNGDGSIILPVSKFSCGFVVGGGEYPFSKDKRKVDVVSREGMAGVSSGGVTIMPVGFLVCGREKKFVSIDNDVHESKWTDLLKCVINIVSDDK